MFVRLLAEQRRWTGGSKAGAKSTLTGRVMGHFVRLSSSAQRLGPLFWSDGSLMFQPHCLASSAWLDSVAAKEALGNLTPVDPCSNQGGSCAASSMCMAQDARTATGRDLDHPNTALGFTQRPLALRCPRSRHPVRPALRLGGANDRPLTIPTTSLNGQDPVRLTPRATDDAVRGRWKHASNHSIT